MLTDAFFLVVSAAYCESSTGGRVVGWKPSKTCGAIFEYRT